MQHTGSERCMHHAATAQPASNFCLAVWLAPMLPANVTLCAVAVPATARINGANSSARLRISRESC